MAPSSPALREISIIWKALKPPDRPDQAMWHKLPFSELSKLLERLADQRDVRGSDNRVSQLLHDYVAFLGLHVCQEAGCFGTIAARLFNRHAGAIAEALKGRDRLRLKALQALTPDFDRMGLIFNPTNRKDSYRLEVRDETSAQIPGRDNQVIFLLKTWGSTPAIVIDLKRSCPHTVSDVRKWFKYRGRGSGEKRVVSLALNLPSRRSPFPFTTASTGMFIEHMRLVLREFEHEHMKPGMGEIERLQQTSFGT